MNLSGSEVQTLLSVPDQYSPNRRCGRILGLLMLLFRDSGGIQRGYYRPMRALCDVDCTTGCRHPAAG